VTDDRQTDGRPEKCVAVGGIASNTTYTSGRRRGIAGIHDKPVVVTAA